MKFVPERARATVMSARLLVAACVCGLSIVASSAPARATEPPLLIRGMTFVSTQGALTEIVLEAENARIDADSEIADLDRVHALLSAPDGSVSLDLTCNEGEFDLRTSHFVAKGDVRGLLADGRSFRGPWLRFDHDTGIAFTDAPVEITDGSRTFRGGGFRYHVREGRLRLTSGASVEEEAP